MSSIESWIAKFPKKLWIANFEVAIHWVPLAHAKLKDGEDVLDGCAEHDPAEIYFCNSLTLMVLLETVYHEVTHFVDFVSDIEDGVDEEDIADKHGKVWTALWLNNPKFQQWWNAACGAVRKERAGVPPAKKRKKPTAEVTK